MISPGDSSHELRKLPSLATSASDPTESSATVSLVDCVLIDAASEAVHTSDGAPLLLMRVVVVEIADARASGWMLEHRHRTRGFSARCLTGTEGRGPGHCPLTRLSETSQSTDETVQSIFVNELKEYTLVVITQRSDGRVIEDWPAERKHPVVLRSRKRDR